jgi:hypothetical protein
VVLLSSATNVMARATALFSLGNGSKVQASDNRIEAADFQAAGRIGPTSNFDKLERQEPQNAQHRRHPHARDQHAAGSSV